MLRGFDQPAEMDANGTISVLPDGLNTAARVAKGLDENGEPVPGSVAGIVGGLAPAAALAAFVNGAPAGLPGCTSALQATALIRFPGGAQPKGPGAPLGGLWPVPGGPAQAGGPAQVASLSLPTQAKAKAAAAQALEMMAQARAKRHFLEQLGVGGVAAAAAVAAPPATLFGAQAKSFRNGVPQAPCVTAQAALLRARAAALSAGHGPRGVLHQSLHVPQPLNPKFSISPRPALSRVAFFAQSPKAFPAEQQLISSHQMQLVQQMGSEVVQMQSQMGLQNEQLAELEVMQACVNQGYELPTIQQPHTSSLHSPNKEAVGDLTNVMDDFVASIKAAAAGNL